MNINNDSDISQPTYIDEGRGSPKYQEKGGCAVGSDNLQVPKTGILVQSDSSPMQIAMDYNSPHPSIETPSGQRTNFSVSTMLNSPMKFVTAGHYNSFCVSGSDSVNVSPNSKLPSSPVSSLTNHPARKRLKLSDSDKGSCLEDISGLRRRILEYKLLRHRSVREKYAEHCAEFFYLHAGGNMMDYHAWRKRPPTPQLISHLRTYRLDSRDEDEDLSKILYLGISSSQAGSVLGAPQGAEIKIPGVGVTPVAISTTLPAAVAQLNQQGGTPLLLEGATNLKNLVLSGSGSIQQSNTQEQIVEKAKQEAYVMQRISELQKEGLWTEKRLPKVMEPPRPKAHWDYLLEEMVWLAADFAQERKWKKAAAKKCARMVHKYFQEKALAAQKAEKAQELQLRRIASFVAKEIKIFWSNVEKLVEFKQQTKLEEERKRALDQQLSFIVDQTEKYSQQLAEGMRSHTKHHHTSSKGSSTSVGVSDDEFCPSGAISSDDEETIAAAEKEDKNHGNDSTKAEVEALQRESQMDLDDFLNELPADYLENRDKIKLSDDECGNETTDEEGEDSEFQADENSSDDEDTIMEQEKQEGQKDHKQEIDELKAESEMSIDELIKKYNTHHPVSASQVSNREESDISDMGSTCDDEDTDESITEDEGLDALVEDPDTKKLVGDEDHRMEDAAAIAESIQPTGNTLSSTQVVTKVPFLLKHSLREYQHIGLDWLVTMEQRRLNGILADEMGLGKTIQTIALLSHLACEKRDWGPHLIVVPTSVMLNWEMECKKWCPSFKILTYYGSIKERKLKRIGWTKPNAFHICITSYKLVIQDHQSFRRKKWKYLILDEAQNIKNFKSQRWQLLLNFQTQQRLLLTGTPLQNNLMELWSLMHFLMPDIFASHREFKEWFSNPVTGMIEGNSEYNDNIIKRLHKVLRPFLLRRLKSEVEKQMPKKYEHVVMCRLSKRQRFLYDDFMSRAKTKETLAGGNMLSVINVLMQLRKVCNHPNLFEVRPTISPFQMEHIQYGIPSLVYNMSNYEPLKNVDLTYMNLNLLHLESNLTAFASYQTNRLATPRKLIEEIESAPTSPPRCPPVEFRLHVTLRPVTTQPASRTASLPNHIAPPPGASPRPDTRRIISQAFAEAIKNVVPPSTRQRPVLRVPPLQSGDSPALGGAADPPSAPNGLGTSSALGARIALLSPLTPRTHRQLSSARTAQVSPIVREKSPEQNMDRPQAEFHQPSVEENLKQQRKYKLKMINAINERRCNASPIYGADLRDCCTVSKPFCDILQSDINTIDSYINKMMDIFDRYIVFICGAVSPGIRQYVSHGSVWRCEQEERLQEEVSAMFKPVSSLVHPVASRLATHFPDPRLIQYDCGKLQTMDVLLRKLKSEQHRVLIFTQMTRMLDVLEAFLNFHGHIYLRLDGTTRIEQRQLLMERFNNDRRIFAFILSTRSGGVGVNLTGADTVIFYDSDWNPTMDAQAQDRCHRIGQTRDVHIYRLISEKTVEENILKKANQKRMLGDVAIEGGNFTTAYFKSTTIQELFNVGGSTATVSEEPELVSVESATSGGTSLESALAQCEDEADVAAARTARAEAAADLAEFDENIPIEEQQPIVKVEMTKAEQELKAVIDQLSPVERYAMRLVEASEAATSAERNAVADLERQRRDWQAARLAIASPPMTTPEGSPTPELTFSREDADNQVIEEKQNISLMRRSKRQPSSAVLTVTVSQKGIGKIDNYCNKSVTSNRLERKRVRLKILKNRFDEKLDDSHVNNNEKTRDQKNDENQLNESHLKLRESLNNNSESEDVQYRSGDRLVPSVGSITAFNLPNENKKESPRTRSRGGIKLNLFNLDDSPIPNSIPNDTLNRSNSPILKMKKKGKSYSRNRVMKDNSMLKSVTDDDSMNYQSSPLNHNDREHGVSSNLDISNCDVSTSNISIGRPPDSLQNHFADGSFKNEPNRTDLDAFQNNNTSTTVSALDSLEADLNKSEMRSLSTGDALASSNASADFQTSQESVDSAADASENRSLENFSLGSKTDSQNSEQKTSMRLNKLSTKANKSLNKSLKRKYSVKKKISDNKQTSLDSWLSKRHDPASSPLIKQPIVSIRALSSTFLIKNQTVTLNDGVNSLVSKNKVKVSLRSNSDSNNEI